MIKLFLLFLWLWAMGILFFGLIAILDFVFVGSFKMFAKRIGLTLIWPFTLLTAKSRHLLFHVFKDTQERK